MIPLNAVNMNGVTSAPAEVMCYTWQLSDAGVHRFWTEETNCSQGSTEYASPAYWSGWRLKVNKKWSQTEPMMLAAVTKTTNLLMRCFRRSRRAETEAEA